MVIMWIMALAGLLGMAVGLLGIWRMINRPMVDRHPAPVDNANLERLAIRGPFLSQRDRP